MQENTLLRRMHCPNSLNHCRADNHWQGYRNADASGKLIYINIHATPTQDLPFLFFFIFPFAESIGGEKTAAMARRKKEQEFLQVLGSDNLAAEGMSEA